MLSDAFIVLLLALCPWASEPLPPIIRVEEPHFAAMLAARGLEPGSRAFIAWFGTETVMYLPIIYLGPHGHTIEVVCHELKHKERVRWHG